MPHVWETAVILLFFPGFCDMCLQDIFSKHHMANGNALKICCEHYLAYLECSGVTKVQRNAYIERLYTNYLNMHDECSWALPQYEDSLCMYGDKVVVRLYW